MGYPEGHKEKTREKIVQAARRLWKTKGYAGASVDKVMEEAGLTRGGFYAHFKSKDDLFIEALSEMLARDTILELERKGIQDFGQQRDLILDYYLSKGHRDHPERGCPLTALTQEAPRIGSGPKQVIAKLVSRFARWLSAERQDDKGLAVLSMMVGAVTLARAVGDDEISAQLLKAARENADHLLKGE